MNTANWIIEVKDLISRLAPFNDDFSESVKGVCLNALAHSDYWQFRKEIDGLQSSDGLRMVDRWNTDARINFHSVIFPAY